MIFRYQTAFYTTKWSKVGLWSFKIKTQEVRDIGLESPDVVSVTDHVTDTSSVGHDSEKRVRAYRPKSFTFNQSVPTSTRFRREKSVLK